MLGHFVQALNIMAVLIVCSYACIKLGDFLNWMDNKYGFNFAVIVLIVVLFFFIFGLTYVL